MLDTVFKVIDLVLELLSYKKEKDLYTVREIADPLFKDLQTVHKNYLESLERVLRILTDTSMNSSTKLNMALSEVLQSKSEYEYIRVKITQLATTFVRELNQEIPWFLFVNSVLMYLFNEDLFTEKSDKRITALTNIERALQSSYVGDLVQIESNILNADKVIKVTKIVRGSVIHFKICWNNVCTEYARLIDECVRRKRLQF